MSVLNHRKHIANALDTIFVQLITQIIGFTKVYFANNATQLHIYLPVCFIILKDS